MSTGWTSFGRTIVWVVLAGGGGSTTIWWVVSTGWTSFGPTRVGAMLAGGGGSTTPWWVVSTGWTSFCPTTVWVQLPDGWCRQDGPASVVLQSGYNSLMGGVDRMDQLRSYYSVGTTPWWVVSTRWTSFGATTVWVVLGRQLNMHSFSIVTIAPVEADHKWTRIWPVQYHN